MKRLLLLLSLVLAVQPALAAQTIREDTATQVAVGPFIDGTDGITAETALTVTEWDCDLVKHADSSMSATSITITASAGSNDAVHLASGMYSLELTATDTNTAGRLTLLCDHATPATFLAVRHEWMVMPTQEYDSLYGTDVQQVHVVEYTSGVITAAAIATDAIGAAEIAADAVGAAEAGFLTDSTGFDGADIAAILTDTGTTLDGKIDTIDGVVDNILIDTGTTLDSALATVDSNVDAILVDTGTTIPGTITTIDDELATVDSNVDAILVDTGTTIPGTITTIDGS